LTGARLRTRASAVSLDAQPPEHDDAGDQFDTVIQTKCCGQETVRHDACAHDIPGERQPFQKEDAPRQSC
jgi:hypothetical protein